MKAFPPNPHRSFVHVRKIPAPHGAVLLNHIVSYLHYPGSWTSWSNTYKGPVYWSWKGHSVTLTLPKGTKAIYLYVEPNGVGKHYSQKYKVTATADGASSGPVPVSGAGGARYFGFFARRAGASVTSVTVTCRAKYGFGFGELGIHG